MFCFVKKIYCNKISDNPVKEQYLFIITYYAAELQKMQII